MSQEAPQPTPKDAALFQVILTSMKNKPEVDWKVVAEKAGYKDAKTASTRYGQIMKKLTGLTGGQALAGITPADAKSSPKKSKAAKPGVGSGTNMLASKVTKAKASNISDRRVGRVGEMKAEVYEDEDEDA